MANANPVEARMAKRRKARKHQKPIDLGELRVIMSDFLEALDAHISAAEGETVDLEKLKSVGYLLNQAVGSYVKLVEVGELEARTDRVEKELHELREEARNARIAN